MQRRFTDFDESWYRYKLASPEEKREMCRERLQVEVEVTAIFYVLGIIGVIIALVKGWV